ncbi:hypothetical protein G4G28_09220 [Massilia sp. Dwa41.01b]|uniref:hypothetical protein n=1 Tax=unclassified Massilia TaxID=2609279 RepID=UPI0016017818|nr:MULTISPECIES: hypothetical protein [unclassified Massilia]QNA88628.1 hypothetical protein G4G28_09220 [Massilia sp. Dwa41.01b]QNA99518.1 hypothetical protein G4G31_12875 [Massilia sp. Se16.2.3]
MPEVKFKLSLCGATVLLFLATIALNELLFTRLEFAPGINWVYLPAGVKLLSTLLFAEAGAAGILIASWLVCFGYFFPDDPLRSFIGGILAALAPYLVYRFILSSNGGNASLAGLSAPRLLFYALAFSIASPGLHHLWFALQGGKDELWRSFLVMAGGDLAGTLIVLYAAKAALLLARPSSGSRRN